MADAPNEKSMKKRFNMDSAGFIETWTQHNDNQSDEDWRKFVIHCFDKFTRIGEDKNISTLLEFDAGYKAWNDDTKYTFLSDKCYAKCISIKRRLMKDKNYEVVLPRGYLTRAGKKTTSRIDSTSMMSLFERSNG
tara:strand:+ start:2515 stop:2919 length:405 start_codon:yes stop_codon:yes gene_type:complete